MNFNLSHAATSTQAPSERWSNMRYDERLGVIRKALVANSSGIGANLVVTSTKEDGQVIVSFKEQVGAAMRGSILLDLEVYLKATIDQGLTVWLEPLGDRNSLRNLRGIEVKS